MLESSVHFSVAGSQSSAENSAWVSLLKPGPLVPPVISTLPSGSTVPVRCRRGCFIDSVKRQAGEASFRLITSAGSVGGVAPPAFITLPGADKTAGPQVPFAKFSGGSAVPLAAPRRVGEIGLGGGTPPEGAR